MIWLSWRQFRTAALVGGVVLVALAFYLLVLGIQVRHDGGLAAVELQDRYANRVYLVDAVLLVAPGLLGAFWGAPLVAREHEAGTHRLVWNQSVTRRRWLATKLQVVGVAVVLFAGVTGALLTWAASPYDAAAGDRFSGLLFGTRNVAPVAYALFALILGTVLGLLLRRTLPAMALTLLAVVIVQVAVPTLVRPHLVPAETRTVPMTAEAYRNLSFLGADADVSGLSIPGAWVVSTSRLLGPDGRTVDLARYHSCSDRSPEAAPDCLARLNLHLEARYQPASRYWTFQWLESTLYLAAALLLAGVGLRRIQRRGT